MRSVLALGPDLITIHAAGGRAMMEAARDAAEGARTRPALIGVTVLTSLDDAALEEAGQRGARRRSGCAAGEARARGRARWRGLLRPGDQAAEAGARPTFRLLVPGLRPKGTTGDQARVMTPGEAARLGADWLVVGRPITKASNPAAALARILDEIQEAAS